MKCNVRTAAVAATVVLLGFSAPAARATAPAVAWNLAYSRTFSGDDTFHTSCTDAAGNTYILHEDFNGGRRLVVYSAAGAMLRDDYLPNPNNTSYDYMTVDGAGHLYVAGTKYAGTSNILVAQYDLATMAQLWEAAPYDSGQDDYVHGLAPDPTGGVLVAGYSRNFGTGDSNALLLDFSSLGVFRFASIVDFGLDDVGYNAAADTAGNVYLFGQSYVNADSIGAIFAAKYLASTGAPVWTRTIESGVGLYTGVGAVWPGTATVFLAGGDSVDTLVVVRLDAGGNVSASGWFTDANTPTYAGGVTVDPLGRPTVSALTCCDAGGVTDAVFVRFTAALGVEPGSSLHVDTGGRDAEPYNVLPRLSVIADASGSLYVAMVAESGSAGCFNRGDLAVRKYGSAPGATPLWAKTYDGVADIRVQGAARDPGGNVYAGVAIGDGTVAGFCKFSPDGHLLWETFPTDNAFCSPHPAENGVAQNAVTAFLSTTATRISNNVRELVVFKRDAATGVPAGRIIINAVADLGGAPIAVDPGGNIYLASAFYSTTTTEDDLLLTKIDAADTPVWTKTVSNIADDNVRTIALDGAGHFYLLGVDDDPASHYVVVKYDAATGTKLWSRSYAGGLQRVLEGGNLVARGNRVWFCGTDMQGFLAAANGRVFALDDTGAVLWTQTITAPSANVGFEGLDVNAAGEVFVTGVAYPPSTQVLDLFTAGLDANGAVKWTQRYDTGSAGDIGYVAVTADPGVIVVATTQNDARLIRYQDAVPATGIRGFDKPAVAYPNPVAGDTLNLALQLDGAVTELRVQALTPSGRVAYEGVWHSVAAADGGVTITGVSRWAPGRYLLRAHATLAAGGTKDFPVVKVIVRR